MSNHYIGSRILISCQLYLAPANIAKIIRHPGHTKELHQNIFFIGSYRDLDRILQDFLSLLLYFFKGLQSLPFQLLNFLFILFYCIQGFLHIRLGLTGHSAFGK